METDASTDGKKLIFFAEEHEYAKGQFEDELQRIVAEAVQTAVEAEREECAKVAENGNFLHDDAPAARFGKACAKAIRARGTK